MKTIGIRSIGGAKLILVQGPHEGKSIPKRVGPVKLHYNSNLKTSSDGFTWVVLLELSALCVQSSLANRRPNRVG